MEIWELEARESIRDIVARYNANGDSGRYDQVVELFAPDAKMTVRDTEYTGREEIRSIFTGAAAAADWSDHPVYLRHSTATLQIDVIDRDHAKGRCYYSVLTAVGLDHWGRYLDEYVRVDGVWRFSNRKVTLDGRSADSLFAPR
jgi:3-phenylpropionate/cinnamic acid dioxygenase small subunit